jgi:hypothetical protein
MERLRRVFAIDLSICPDCGGRLQVQRARYLGEALLEYLNVDDEFFVGHR